MTKRKQPAVDTLKQPASRAGGIHVEGDAHQGVRRRVKGGLEGGEREKGPNTSKGGKEGRDFFPQRTLGARVGVFGPCKHPVRHRLRRKHPGPFAIHLVDQVCPVRLPLLRPGAAGERMTPKTTKGDNSENCTAVSGGWGAGQCLRDGGQGSGV